MCSQVPARRALEGLAFTVRGARRSCHLTPPGSLAQSVNYIGGTLASSSTVGLGRSPSLPRSLAHTTEKAKRPDT